MKSIEETLRLKEQEMKRLEIEIGILRSALSILEDEREIAGQTAAVAAPSAPVANVQAAAPAPARINDWVVSTIPSSASPGPYSATEAKTTAAPTAERPVRSFP